MKISFTMPNLRVISVLFFLSFIIFGGGENLEEASVGKNGKEFFDKTARRFKDYAGIFTNNMETDMWIFVFLAAILTFGICFAVYFFDMFVFYTRQIINRFHNR